jgi:hypothetical protein
MFYDANGVVSGKKVWQNGTAYTLRYEADGFGRMTKITYPQSGGTMVFVYVPYVFEMTGMPRRAMQITDNRAGKACK